MSPRSTTDGLDIYNLREKLRKETEKVKSWNTTEENKRIFLEHLLRREAEGTGIVQRIKDIDSVRTLVQFNGKNFFSFTEKDLQDFVLSMGRFKPRTRHIKWYAVKKFFEFIGKGELYRTFKPRFVKKKTKLPEELLTQEEVNQMIQKAYSIRDKALIAVLYESGCPNCKAKKLDIKDALEKGIGKKLSHEEVLKRIKKSGLLLVLESRR